MLSVQGLTDSDHIDSGHIKQDTTELPTKNIIAQKFILPLKQTEIKQTYTIATAEQLNTSGVSGNTSAGSTILGGGQLQTSTKTQTLNITPGR